MRIEKVGVTDDDWEGELEEDTNRVMVTVTVVECEGVVVMDGGTVVARDTELVTVEDAVTARDVVEVTLHDVVTGCGQTFDFNCDRRPWQMLDSGVSCNINMHKTNYEVEK